jgi:chromosome segregation ATPase
LEKYEKGAPGHSGLVEQLNERIASFEKAISDHRQRNRKRGGEIKNLRSKIHFLETLVISKDNNEHLANRNMKKMEKEKAEMQKQIGELEEHIRLMGNHHQNELARI